MGVSLGARVAGLCLAGTVAVVGASCAAGVAEVPGRDVRVPSAGGPGGTAQPAAGAPLVTPPSWRPEGGSGGGPVEVPRPALTVPSASPVQTPSASPSASSSPSVPVPPTASVSARPVVAPAWLPPGPASPDTDGVPDPASLYDRLRAPGTGCAEVVGVVPVVPPSDDWRLLRGLAEGCLAVQGAGGSWAAAEREHAELADRVAGCKGLAAYAVLTGLLEFHRLHPGATVPLGTAASGAAPACAYGIAAVDAGPDGAARPGELVTVELRGAYFDHAELLRDGAVSVGGVDVPGPLTALPVAGGDGPRLAVTVPVLSGEPGTPVDVRVRYAGTEVAREGAFVLAAPGPLTPAPTP